MNLTILQKSRRVLEPGDIFAMLPPVGGYLYGRVINVNANVLGYGGGILIYIYKKRADEKMPVPELYRDRLLFPPVITNKRPWTMGFFEHLEHRTLTATDRLAHHCFKNSWGQYFDEAGHRLAGPVEPVGAWALDSFQTIDESISRALEIPLGLDDEKVKSRKRL